MSFFPNNNSPLGSILEVVSTTNKVRGRVSGTMNLVSGIIMSIFLVGIAIIIAVSGGPWFIVPIAILVAIGIVWMAFVAHRRAAAVKLYPDQGIPVSLPVINFLPTEKVVAVLPGIQQTFAFGAPLIRSMAFGGTGEIKYPHNGVIITDQHIILLYVPMAGGDSVIGGVDLGKILFNPVIRNEIKEKMDAMISSMSLDQIYRSYNKNIAIALSDIANFETSDIMRRFVITTRDGKKYAYTMLFQDDFSILKAFFRNKNVWKIILQN